MCRYLLTLLAGFACCLCAHSTTAQTWQRITPNVPGALGSGNIGPMATDGTRLYVLGARGVFVSNNGGDTFQAINSVPGASYGLEKYGHRFVGVANGFVWVGSDPGSAAINDAAATLHRLIPGQTTWTKSAAGFPIGTVGNQADDIAYDAATGTYYVAAAIGGAFVSTDGVNWEARNNGNGGVGLPATVETIDGAAFMVRPLGGINKTTDRGLTWSATRAFPGPSSSYLLALNGRLMIAVNGNNLLQDGLYYSDDQGTTWTFSQGLAGTHDLTTDGSLVYAAGPGRGLKFSATGGLTWDNLPLTGTPASFSVTRLVRVGGGLFLLGNSGGVPELYRMDASNYPFNPTTQIAGQPTNSPALLVGDSHTFRVAAGGRNLRYQWRKNGVDIPGAAAAALTFSSLVSGDTGSYAVVVTGDFGLVTSATVTLSVTSRETGRYDPTFLPPQISGVSVVLDDFSVVTLTGFSVARSRGDSGARVADRTLPSGNFQRIMKDSRGRILVMSTGPNPPHLLRLDPITLLDDPSFKAPVMAGHFTAIAELPGRGYLAGTAPNATVSGQPLNPVILCRYDGSVDPSFDTGESPVESFNSVVSGIWVTPAGNIYVASNVGTLSAPTLLNRSQIHRLTPSGQVDPSFDPAGMTQVYFVHPLNGERLLVVTESFNATLRAIKSDGVFDATFNPTGARLNQPPLAAVEQTDGKIILAGGFTSFGPNQVGKHMRLNRDGTLDPAYYNTVSYNGAANVTSLSYDPRGFIYYSPSVVSTSATFQSSTVRGLVRVFTEPSSLAIFSQTTSQRVALNESFVLSINIVSASAATYQWFKDGGLIPGATSASLTIPSFTAKDNGAYTVEARNSSGVITSRPVDLAVISTPEIYFHPASASKQLGSSYTFSVVASGAGTLSYAWRKDGVAIAGATGSTLTLTNIQFNAEGDYTVVIGNAFGSITSQAAALAVFEITGAIVPAFAAVSLGGGITKMDLMPDGSLLLGGTFLRPGNQDHPWFTRIDTNGMFVPGWTNNPPGGITAGIGVYCVKALANGQAIIAGQFGRIGGVQRVGFARLNANGTVDESFGHATIGPNSAVEAFEPLPDGTFLVGGIFTQWGAEARLGLVRLTAGGLLDPSFAPALNDFVSAIHVLPGGRAFVAGRFSSIGGQVRSRIARLNPDGAVDASFVPPVIDQPISSMGVDSAGRIVIGGFFTTVDGIAQRRIARLNPDGTLDTTFASEAQFSSPVQSIDVQLNDKIIAAGNVVARLLPSGAVDPTFQLAPALNGGVGLVRATPEGRLYLTGSFTSPVRSIVAVTTDRAELAITRAPSAMAAEIGAGASLSAVVHTLSPATYQWLKEGVPIAGATSPTLRFTSLAKADAGLYALRVVNSTRVITSSAVELTVLAEPVLKGQPVAKSVAAGSRVAFSAASQGAGALSYQWRKNGFSISNAVGDSLTIPSASLDDAAIYDVVVSNTLGVVTSRPAGLGVFVPAGKLDLSFNPGAGPNNTVFASALLPGGNLAIGGAFTAVNGQARNRFAVLDPAGGLVNLATNPAFNQQVTALAAQPDGKFFVTTFVSISRYNADGKLDTSFPNLGEQGNAIALSGDTVYFAGYFGSQNPSVRKFSTITGVEDATFKANASGIRGWTPQSLFAYPDGRVLVADPGNGVRRLIADGSADTSFVPPQIAYSGGGPRPISAIQAAANGSIWIGGLFTSVGGQPRNYIARLHSNGAVDTALPDPGLNGQVRALHLADGAVFLAGDFFPVVAGLNYRGFLKMSAVTGLIDPAFGPFSLNQAANTLADAGNGKLVLAGTFATPLKGVARVVTRSDVQLAVTVAPTSVNANQGDPINLTVAWKGGGEATYQWKKNGQTLPGATEQSLLIPSVEASNAGDYTVILAAGGETVSSAAAAVRVRGGGGNASFTLWKSQHPFPPNLDSESSDADGDGLNNLVEFYLGSNPLDKKSGPRPSSGAILVDGATYPAVTFIRNKAAAGLRLEVVASSTVVFSDNLGTTEITEDLGDGTERVVLRSNTRTSAQPTQFIRLNLAADPLAP